MRKKVENVQNMNYDPIVDAAMKKRNAPKRISDFLQKRLDAFSASLISLTSAGVLGVVLFYTLGLPWMIVALATMGIVGINEGIVAVIYNKKINNMLDKYPEFDGMDKEQLMQESQKREAAYEKWNKLEDKSSVPYEEFIKKETDGEELGEDFDKLLTPEVADNIVKAINTHFYSNDKKEQSKNDENCNL